MNWLRRTFGRFWPIFLIGGMLAVFLIFATKQENLDVYNGGNSTYTVETESESEKKIVSNTYLNNTIALSMQIPDGWQHVTKDGYDTYIHSASASSIQIQVLSYYPMVNNTSVDSLTETYSARGMTLTEFQYTADNSYYVIYQSQGMSGITDYIEYVIWDRQHVAKVVVTFNDANYDKLKDEIWYSLNSISWDYEDPISEGFLLNYQIAGDFEYAVPDTWTTGSADTTYYAYEESSGAMLTVNVLEDTSLLSEITQLDYSNFLSNGKSNFVLTQFEQSDTSIYGEATYMNNDVQMGVMQEYYATGQYQYIVTYEFPVDLGQSYVELAQNGLALTRIFNSAVPEETSESMTEDTDPNAVFTPDGLPEKTESEPETSTGTEAASESEEQASSFSDALIQVSGISQEKADEISAIWASLNAGIPTYAKGYKESDTDFILLVTNDQSVNYYIQMSKEGDLKEIRVNTEDGPVVYQK